MRGFKNAAAEEVPISLEALEREYCKLMAQSYPIVEMVFVRSWMLFRVCFNVSKPLLCYVIGCPFIRLTSLLYFLVSLQLAIISQGIAARYARRQASSEIAFIHPIMFPIVGELARKVLEDEGICISSKSGAGSKGKL